MRTVHLCSVALVLANLAIDGAVAQQFPPAQIKQGAALFAANCAVCHGQRMKDPPWAIDLATFPRDEPMRFVNSVTDGVRNMPPWGDVLKPEDIKALWAYVVEGEKGN
jgi:mono/diheme cytochrome c family protein